MIHGIRKLKILRVSFSREIRAKSDQNIRVFTVTLPGLSIWLFLSIETEIFDFDFTKIFKIKSRT